MSFPESKAGYFVDDRDWIEYLERLDEELWSRCLKRLCMFASLTPYLTGEIFPDTFTLTLTIKLVDSDEAREILGIG